MSSSELSNALNPAIVAQRPRRKHAAPTNAAVLAATPTLSSAVPQPHRSELELAIAPPALPLPPQYAAAQSPVVQAPQPPRNAAPVVQELYRVMVTAKDAVTAERDRRVAWEKEQEARASQKQAEMERQILDMRQELSLLKAYISLHPNMAPPVELQQHQQEYVQTIPTTARIEPASPVMGPEPSPQPPMSPISPVPYHPPLQQPMFVEGSSSRPLAVQAAYPEASSPISQSALPLLGPPTPQSTRPTPSPAHTPALQANPLKRTRLVLEDESDYDTDTEDESDTQPTDRPLKRKNGHDGRCLTIHHAVRIHIRKMMKLKPGQDLPESAFEGEPIAAEDPVRFVWGKTAKQSTTNAAMKKRILTDLKSKRHKYKYVPDKEFAKKTLDAAFEQVFTTLRQNFKAQRDGTAATKLKRREDHKALRSRRQNRKKAKLGNRTEARKKVDAFAQPIFDGALQQECMSSEESDGEYAAEGSGETVQVFRTRGLQWRSSRLRRFYAVLDEQDRFDKSLKPKRGVGRRERREGLPKDGFFLPPKGVARWMVSRRWLQETAAMRPDVIDILRELIVDPAEPETELAQLMLGPEYSDEEQDQAQLATNLYAHVSDTSYSLHNALQPV
ncbi:hypothetical protein C8T65DRAFT_581790 [Cerioporus squamosus]|nr:hypothetical protein C8T65DRAFT_581790 [Cerioporus squamosus]